MRAVTLPGGRLRRERRGAPGRTPVARRQTVAIRDRGGAVRHHCRTNEIRTRPTAGSNSARTTSTGTRSPRSSPRTVRTTSPPRGTTNPGRNIGTAFDRSRSLIPTTPLGAIPGAVDAARGRKLRYRDDDAPAGMHEALDELVASALQADRDEDRGGGAGDASHGRPAIPVDRDAFDGAERVYCRRVPTTTSAPIPAAFYPGGERLPT